MQERKAFAWTLDGTIFEESPLAMSPIVEEQNETGGFAVGSETPPASAVDVVAIPATTESTTETEGVPPDQPDVRSQHDDVERVTGLHLLQQLTNCDIVWIKSMARRLRTTLVVDHEVAPSTDSLIVIQTMLLRTTI